MVRESRGAGSMRDSRGAESMRDSREAVRKQCVRDSRDFRSQSTKERCQVLLVIAIHGFSLIIALMFGYFDVTGCVKVEVKEGQHAA